MPIELVTAPTKYPVTLSEVKKHLRIEDDFTDHDVMLNNLISTVTTDVENDTWRRLVSQTWNYHTDEFTDFELPFGQLQSVTHIKYYDIDNVQQTLSTSIYDVDTLSDPGKISLAYGQAWPSIYSRPNPIEVQFVCGYSPVPEVIKTAIKIRIEMEYGTFYDNEYDILKLTYFNLISPYKLEVF